MGHYGLKQSVRKQEHPKIVCQYSTEEEILSALWNADSGREINKCNTSADKKDFKAVNSRLEELELKAKTTYKR